MDHILATLVGPERAQQLRDSPTIDLVHDNLRLVHFSIILHRHRRNELYIELAARATVEDFFLLGQKGSYINKIRQAS